MKIEYQKPKLTELEPVGEAEEVFPGETCQILQDPNDRITSDYGLLKYQPGSITGQLMEDGIISKEIWISEPIRIKRVRGRRTEEFIFPGCSTTTVSIRVGDQIIMENIGDTQAIVIEKVWPAWGVNPNRYKEIGL